MVHAHWQVLIDNKADVNQAWPLCPKGHFLFERLLSSRLTFLWMIFEIFCATKANRNRENIKYEVFGPCIVGGGGRGQYSTPVSGPCAARLRGQSAAGVRGGSETARRDGPARVARLSHRALQPVAGAICLRISFKLY